MLKPKRSRRQEQRQSPVSEMEQFYLNQYFQALPNHSGLNSTKHPYAIHYGNFRTQTPDLEMRITRIEQYLGLPPL